MVRCGGERRIDSVSQSNMNTSLTCFASLTNTLVGLVCFLLFFIAATSEQSKCDLDADSMHLYVQRSLMKFDQSGYIPKVEQVDSCICEDGDCIEIITARPSTCKAFQRMSAEQVGEYCVRNPKAPEFMCEGKFNISTPWKIGLQCDEALPFI
uniref:Uncharacterized protein n=1 Tax=Trichuris muris TaxID=70415 RepID=A0A5S6QPZ2_TRIMR